MPKKQSDTTSYFPHPAETPQVLGMLQSKFNHKAYVLWYRLREVLCRSEGHFYNARESLSYSYLSSLIGIEPETMTQMLDLMAGWNVIDPKLWEQKIIWWQDLVDDFSDVYLKRKRSSPEAPQVDSISNQLEPKSKQPARQSRLEQSKSEESKANLDAFKKLLCLKVPDNDAIRISKSFPEDYIDLKILYWQCRVETAKKPIKNPVGYLIQYLDEDFKAPAGFDDWYDDKKRNGK